MGNPRNLQMCRCNAQSTQTVTCGRVNACEHLETWRECRRAHDLVQWCALESIFGRAPSESPSVLWWFVFVTVDCGCNTPLLRLQWQDFPALVAAVCCLACRSSQYSTTYQRHPDRKPRCIGSQGGTLTPLSVARANAPAALSVPRTPHTNGICTHQ